MVFSSEIVYTFFYQRSCKLLNYAQIATGMSCSYESLKCLTYKHSNTYQSFQTELVYANGKLYCCESSLDTFPNNMFLT